LGEIRQTQARLDSHVDIELRVRDHFVLLARRFIVFAPHRDVSALERNLSSHRSVVRELARHLAEDPIDCSGICNGSEDLGRAKVGVRCDAANVRRHVRTQHQRSILLQEIARQLLVRRGESQHVLAEIARRELEQLAQPAIVAPQLLLGAIAQVDIGLLASRQSQADESAEPKPASTRNHELNLTRETKTRVVEPSTANMASMSIAIASKTPAEIHSGRKPISIGFQLSKPRWAICSRRAGVPIKANVVRGLRTAIRSEMRMQPKSGRRKRTAAAAA
jgi:hypothetical protein